MTHGWPAASQQQGHVYAYSSGSNAPTSPAGSLYGFPAQRPHYNQDSSTTASATGSPNYPVRQNHARDLSTPASPSGSQHSPGSSVRQPLNQDGYATHGDHREERKYTTRGVPYGILSTEKPNSYLPGYPPVGQRFHVPVPPASTGPVIPTEVPRDPTARQELFERLRAVLLQYYKRSPCWGVVEFSEYSANVDPWLRFCVPLAWRDTAAKATESASDLWLDDDTVRLMHKPQVWPHDPRALSEFLGNQIQLLHIVAAKYNERGDMSQTFSYYVYAEWDHLYNAVPAEWWMQAERHRNPWGWIQNQFKKQISLLR
ncbi:hypothetical protein C8R47DRAFT_213215 [Mycena vitilis]|nr:hypothetical protein C8R47DRAFT_213215 [Mycena vitilis]